MLVTSFGVGIGLICLLAFIVIPAFSRSSDLLSNMASSSDADQNANDVVLTQNHSRYEVTPPEVPPPSPTLLPTQGAAPTNNQPGSGPTQSMLSVPPPPPFPPAFSNPSQRPGRHIIITIHRVPAQNENIIPPTPPADLTPPPAPPLMPPPSMLPPVTPTATAATAATATAATATVTATVTALPTPQVTATTVPLTPTATATSVPTTPGTEPSTTVAPASRSSISAFWQHE
ncbi:hypothetical protein [Dictyobacter aurantiacus]|uniref:hypothetical protein n=1 Tax=Dictyobacter aurantiacus TaxID=1936993 RepID=UPI000F8352C4|nr:hypothetical protein [Dictyobacter aurantiacus]